MDFDDILDDGFSLVAEEINLKDFEETESNTNQTLFPILPVRNMVMFPKVIVPITAGRKNSIKLLEEAQQSGEFIGIISQKNATVDNPEADDLYQIGTYAKILKIIKLPEGNVTAITKGYGRFKTKQFVENQPYYKAEITKLKDSAARNKEEFD